MSSCEICDCEMHPMDASIDTLCPVCRKANKDRGERVRNLNRTGTDQVGRKARHTGTLGGSPKSSDEDTP